MKLKLLVVTIVLFFILAIILDDSMLIYPIQSIHTYDRRPEFRFVGNAILVVDNDEEFDSPIIEVESEDYYKPKQDLNVGRYYWKIRKGSVESEVREFTIDSVVATKLDDNKLFNKGNVMVGVSKGVTGAVVGTLHPGEFLEVEDNETYTSRQNE